MRRARDFSLVRRKRETIPRDEKTGQDVNGDERTTKGTCNRLSLGFSRSIMELSMGGGNSRNEPSVSRVPQSIRRES